MLKTHYATWLSDDRLQVQTACGRNGSADRGYMGRNGFTYRSGSGKTRFQAVNAKTPLPEGSKALPEVNCEACQRWLWLNAHGRVIYV